MMSQWHIQVGERGDKGDESVAHTGWGGGDKGDESVAHTGWGEGGQG